MRIEVAVSERARYRVEAESAQGRTWAGNVLLFDIRCMNTPTSVYAEMTPNPEVMKYAADRPLIEGNAQAEFTSKADCAGHSSFAEELFNFPFVTGVFISGGFVSVTKDDTIGWEMIAMQMREYIQQWRRPHGRRARRRPGRRRHRSDRTRRGHCRPARGIRSAGRRSRRRRHRLPRIHRRYGSCPPPRSLCRMSFFHRHAHGRHRAPAHVQTRRGPIRRGQYLTCQSPRGSVPS